MKLLTPLLVASLALAPLVTAAPAQEEAVTREQALQKLQAGEFEEALADYETLLEASPKDAELWHLHGFALHSLGRLDEALRSHVEAYELGTGRVRSLGAYNAACALSLKGDVEEALAWLHKSLEHGAVTPQQAEADSDLDNVRDTDGYRAFLARLKGEEPPESMEGSEVPGPAAFDFWIGEWTCTWEGGSGTNSVERILDGKAIREDFRSNAEGEGALDGTSLTVWDPEREVWKQTWVDNQGGYLLFEGGWTDGKMVLTRSYDAGGETVMDRMTFHDISESSFDWEWENSTDGGRTWNPSWSIHYERRPQAAEASAGGAR